MDERKTGYVDIAPGTRCVLKCPVSGEPLKRVEDIDDPVLVPVIAPYTERKRCLSPP